MFRRTILVGAVLALACGEPGPKKTGPVIAEGKGVRITADEFKARIEEQSPFMRARYTTLERKKEFLDNLVQFELIAQEAQKEGLANDPDVQLALKKLMVQKYLQKKFGEAKDAPPIPDEELKAYYDAHLDDYVRPARRKVSLVAWNTAEDSPDRAKKIAAAKKAIATLQAAEKKNDRSAFSKLATAESEDETSKAKGGDLGYKSAAELEQAYSKELADAVFQLEPGQLSGLIETPKALYVAKVISVQDEVRREFESVKAQIASKLSRERRSKDLETWRKALAERAKVKVDEAALEKIEIATGPAGAQPGNGGMPPGHGGMGGPRAMPAPAPQSAPGQ